MEREQKRDSGTETASKTERGRKRETVGERREQEKESGREKMVESETKTVEDGEIESERKTVGWRPQARLKEGERESQREKRA